MKAQPSGRMASGFTLIELVISGSLMALILVSAYLCLSSGFSSQKLIESRIDALQTARVALARISADLAAACPLSKEIEFLGMDRTSNGVEADNLDFGTHHYTPRRSREADFCQVSYFLSPVTESGQLSLWRRRNPTIGVDPLSGGSREEIARGVRGLRFEYYDGIDWYDEWGDPDGRGKAQTSWREHPNLSGMPEAVRITLWLEPNFDPSTDTSPGGDAKRRALVFQTVARLNLAATTLGSTASTSSGGSATDSNPEPKPPSSRGGPE